MKKDGVRIVNSNRVLEWSPWFLAAGRFGGRCHVGSLYFLIDQEGKVAPCHAFPGTLHAYKENFVEQYHKLVRKGFFEGSRMSCHGCMHPCWIELSLMLEDRRSFYEAFLLNVSLDKNREFLDAGKLHDLAARVRGNPELENGAHSRKTSETVG
jgi:hypothetical protein